jgi:heterodisulfide reductase subunit A
LEELDVGSVVLSPGYSLYNPELSPELGYGRYANVVTSIEFERMLSASGPWGGHLTRRSPDHREPKKIAFLQCIGSRDIHEGAKAYCSAVCCTYAIKEAVVAKEHSKEPLDTAIFYIDMRTYGKDFERYYNRAVEAGVRFIKSRISEILPKETGDLLIQYADETGRRVEETFDLVVLSVGIGIPKDTVDLAKRLDIHLDPYAFTSTSSFEPVQTSRSGIFVCGAFQAPKDIPDSVIQASGAAARALATIGEARGTLIRTKEYPPEREVTPEEGPRIGAFICSC